MSSTRTSSTPSEGEIVEDSISDTEKATTSLPSVNGTSVNRSTRPRTSPAPPALPRSPAPPQSILSPRRDRSRSPYRERRGEKRRHDDEYPSDRGKTDSRRYNPRYDDGRQYDDRRQQRSYADLDRGDTFISRMRYDDDDRRFRDKRPRTRSRSPFQHGRRKGDEPRKSRSPYRHERDRTYSGRTGGPTSEQSVSERGRPSGVAHKSKYDAESQGNQVKQDVEMSDASNQADRTESTSFADHVGGDNVNSKPIDEATLIEERRKRREAIKAKYRGQATPLLVQALQLGNKTGPSTPSAAVNDSELRSNDSALSSPPQTPKDSEPSSPVLSDGDPGLQSGEDLLKKDESIKPSSQLDAEEPSAADYDPTMDMQEDRIKQDKRQQGDEISASAYDETEPQRREIPVPGITKNHMSTPKADVKDAEKKKSRKPSDAFDMFAEDFDDDFTSDTASVKNLNGGPQDLENTTKKHLESRGKQLDESMLDNWDDPEGYYRIILGERIHGRYTVQANLGKGVFSSVVRAVDHENNGQLVAIKVIRANDTMKKAGMKEIGILEQLAAADPDDKKHIVRFIRYFEHKGHLCMVFENLSLNLREVVKRFGRDVGINIRAVRAYAQQMFLAASLLRKCNLLHADVKPDNILVNEAHTSLKICDLGSAAHYNPGAAPSADEITPYLVSRYYRAPEIILGMRPDPAIDMWSIGCTLFELYTGKILFAGRSNNQMLKVVMECRGKFSTKMLKRAAFASLYFDDLGNFQSIEKDKLTGRDVPKLLNLSKPIKDLKARLVGFLGEDGKKADDAQIKELNLFRDLLEKCLELNPEKRVTPGEALKHPFILRSKA